MQFQGIVIDTTNHIFLEYSKKTDENGKWRKSEICIYTVVGRKLNIFATNTLNYMN